MINYKEQIQKYYDLVKQNTILWEKWYVVNLAKHYECVNFILNINDKNLISGYWYHNFDAIHYSLDFYDDWNPGIGNLEIPVDFKLIDNLAETSLVKEALLKSREIDDLKIILRKFKLKQLHESNNSDRIL